MTPEQLELLKQHLSNEFVPHLPPLLKPKSDAAQNETKNVSRAFSAFAIHKITGTGSEAASKSVVDDFDDNGLDAVYYYAARKELLLVQSKLKATEPFQREEAVIFEKGVRDLINQRYELFNDNVQKRQDEIEYALQNADQIVMVVAHSSPTVSQQAQNVFHDLFADANQRDRRLSNKWIDYGPDRAVADLLGENKVEPVAATRIELFERGAIPSPRETYYGQISLLRLIELYEENGNRLLEKNIRFFIGSSSSQVNQAIRQTLADRPEDFFYLSNGVTALAEEITPREVKDTSASYEVSGLSIINGAQTVASSHEFAKENPEVNLNDAKVLFTVIKSDGENDFGLDITKARNHQNRVTASHFAALDANQERLRCELAFANIIYRYRPDSEPPGAGVDAIEIDQAATALASISGKPGTCVILLREPSRFTNPATDEYKEIFGGELSGRKLANTFRLYAAVKSVIEANEKSTSGREKLIYRHGRHALTWLVLRANRQLLNREDVMSASDAERGISESLDSWRQKFVDESTKALDDANIGPLAFFRSLTNTQPFVIHLRDEGV